MYRRDSGLRRHSGTDPGCQVIVKLKRTRQARRVLHAAAADGRMPRTRGVLDRLLSGRRIVAMESVFGAVKDRSLAGFRRLAVEAEREVEAELAGLSILSTRSRRDAARVCDELGKDPLVGRAYVAPERFLLTARRSRSQDPMANRQWGLRAIQLFQAEQLASFPDARDVTVAVIDSGVDSSHPDLAGIFAEEKSFTSRRKRDTSGHGTHVCGIIGAVRNNRRGIRGINQTRSIMSLKALEPYEPLGYYRALRHATDEGARVLNLSLGGSHDPTEEDLVRRAMRRGVVVVAAMGNDKLEGNPKSYPGAIGGVVAVGATDEIDRIADFSQTGSHIDLVAPGVNVLSTVPTYRTTDADGTDYEAWPGTSMAAPFVSAAAALVLARRPTLSVAGVRRALVRGAQKVSGQRGFNTTYGHGRLNVRTTLQRL